LPAYPSFVLSLDTDDDNIERDLTLIATMRSPRARGALIALVACTLVLAACGSSSKSSGSGGGSGTVTLNGSGSTFQQTFDQTVIQAFQSANKGITINYAGGGSGKGKTDLQTKTVDFAGTDSLVKDTDLKSYQGGPILYFPIAAAPITVSFNLSGVNSIQLSGPTLAKIFSGTIKKWNDPAIENDNANATLPDTDIVIVHRGEASGTTSNFTKYLSDAGGSDWTLGSGDTVQWPSSSQAGQGNSGVAQAISQTNGAIGYVDCSDATAAKLKFASIENKAGKFLAPTLAGASAAVASSTIAADLTYSPLNQAGADAYPITSPTWIIAYATQSDHAKGTALKSFLTFILNDGQGLAEGVNYAKLPTSLQAKAVAQLDKLVIPA
jgi:phosphate transport system substrate-binding protein